MTKEYAEKKIREEYDRIVESNDRLSDRLNEDKYTYRAVIALMKDNATIFYNTANMVIKIFIELSDPKITDEWRDLFDTVCDLMNELENRTSKLELVDYMNG